MSIRNQRPKRLVSGTFAKWLDESIFELGDVSYSRHDIAHWTDSPCVRAARNLSKTLPKFQISTLAQLHAVGLDGLLRCAGVGERAAWVAACILDAEGYDVEKWMTMKPRKVVTWRGAIKKAQDVTRKQKHA